MRRPRPAATVLALLFLVSCNSSPDVTPGGAPAAMDTSSLPAVILPTGDRIIVEVAADDLTRARGLMFRDRVEPGHGMLFLFPVTAPHSFWMKNTLVPLDMIWIDDSGTVADVKAGVPPCKADPCPSYAPAAAGRYVLELGSGEAAAKGIRPGTVLRFANLEPYTAR